MTNASELTDQTTSSASGKPKLAFLACTLGLMILVELYAKIIGF
jgi:hypothetical protein